MRAMKFSILYKIIIFQYMGKETFEITHTFFTNTLKDLMFIDILRAPKCRIDFIESGANYFPYASGPNIWLQMSS